MIVVDGFNISTAFRATDENLSGVKLRNIQVSIWVSCPEKADDRSTGTEMTRIYIQVEGPTLNLVVAIRIS